MNRGYIAVIWAVGFGFDYLFQREELGEEEDDWLLLREKVAIYIP